MPRFHLFRLNPISRRRFERFRKTRIAWYSMWLLIGLYVLSLGAELLCNADPLYVRFEGRSYFPFLSAYNDNLPILDKYLTLGIYSEETFRRNGVKTPPNYKAMVHDVAFHDSAGDASKPDVGAAGGDGGGLEHQGRNFMIFSPFPYGESEVIEASSIEVPPDVTVTFHPHTRVGSIDIKADLTVLQSTNAKLFFGVADEQAVREVSFGDRFVVPPALAAQIAQCFANQATAESSTTLKTVDGKSVIVGLRAYEPRSSAPTKLRLRLEELPPDADSLSRVVLDLQYQPVSEKGDLWTRLSDADRQRIVAFAKERQANPIEPQTLTLAGETWRVHFDKEDVRYPFRPIGRHFMGIDNAGRDVFSRILYALRISMNFGLLLVLAEFVIGIVVGAVQGYLGGIVDIATQRFIEIWGSLPFLYVIMFLGASYGRSFLMLLIVYAVFNWIGISYYMRAEFLKLRRETYVEAARCLGIPTWKILLRHMLPNALVPIITFFPFSLVGAIGSLSALDYLGFGLPPPTPSWGELMDQAMSHTDAWWLTIYPFLALFVVILLGVFIGQGLRNAFDPRSRIHIE